MYEQTWTIQKYGVCLFKYYCLEYHYNLVLIQITYNQKQASKNHFMI